MVILLERIADAGPVVVLTGLMSSERGSMQLALAATDQNDGILIALRQDVSSRALVMFFIRVTIPCVSQFQKGMRWAPRDWAW